MMLVDSFLHLGTPSEAGLKLAPEDATLKEGLKKAPRLAEEWLEVFWGLEKGQSSGRCAEVATGDFRMFQFAMIYSIL